MATTTFNGSTDLGNAPEMFDSFARFGRLSPDWTYDALHGVLQSALAGEEGVHPDDIAKLKRQVADFRVRFAAHLTEHDNWLLDQLAAC